MNKVTNAATAKGDTLGYNPNRDSKGRFDDGLTLADITGRTFAPKGTNEKKVSKAKERLQKELDTLNRQLPKLLDDQGELSIADLSRLTGSDRAKVYKQLSVMEAKGKVFSEKRGKSRIYTRVKPTLETASVDDKELTDKLGITDQVQRDKQASSNLDRRVDEAREKKDALAWAKEQGVEFPKAGDGKEAIEAFEEKAVEEYRKSKGNNDLKDAVNQPTGTVFFHGTSLENAQSLQSSGFDTDLNAKGYAEAPYAFYMSTSKDGGDDHSASSYGDTIVDVKLNRDYKLLDGNSQTWADTMGQSLSVQESTEWAVKLKEMGYDGIIEGNGEVSIWNTDDLEVSGAPEGTQALGQLTPNGFTKAVQELYGDQAEWTDTDKEVTNKYAGNWYFDMNSILRGREDYSETYERADVETAINDLRSAMKNELLEDTPLYRGFISTQEIEVGDEINDKGFSSTSFFEEKGVGFAQMRAKYDAENNEMPYVMKINAKAGQKGLIPALQGDQVGLRSNEAEFILPDNMTFRVNAVNDRGDYMELDVDIVPTSEPEPAKPAAANSEPEKRINGVPVKLEGNEFYDELLTKFSVPAQEYFDMSDEELVVATNELLDKLKVQTDNKLGEIGLTTEEARTFYDKWTSWSDKKLIREFGREKVDKIKKVVFANGKNDDYVLVNGLSKLKAVTPVSKEVPNDVIALGSDKVGQPGKYQVYRSGGFSRRVAFTDLNKGVAESYSAVGFGDNDSVVRGYVVDVKKPFVSTDIKDALQKLGSDKTFGELGFVKADNFIAKALTENGYDAWIKTDPEPPATTEINLVKGSDAYKKAKSGDALVAEYSYRDRLLELPREYLQPSAYAANSDYGKWKKEQKAKIFEGSKVFEQFEGLDLDNLTNRIKSSVELDLVNTDSTEPFTWYGNIGPAYRWIQENEPERMTAYLDFLTAVEVYNNQYEGKDV